MFKNILFHTICGLAKIRSVHTYVIPWIHWFEPNCRYQSPYFFHEKYLVRFNRQRSVYSLNQFLGPDFELPSCKNQSQWIFLINMFLLCWCIQKEHKSMNWTTERRRSISLIHFWEVGLFKTAVFSSVHGNLFTFWVAVQG